LADNCWYTDCIEGGAIGSEDAEELLLRLGCCWEWDLCGGPDGGIGQAGGIEEL